MSKEIMKREIIQPVIDEKVVNDYLFSSSLELSEQQKTLFKAIALRNGLDPFKREIYAIPFKNKKTGKTELTIITGYQVYIQRAEKTGLLDGWKVELVKSGNKLIGAKITIYRKDWKYPFEWTALIEEFKRDTSIWRTMPEFMIRKVAIAQGFRLCFPIELGGLPYTAEELPLQEAESVIIEEVEEEKKGKWDKFKFLQAMQKMKKQIGEQQYYYILNQFGFKKSNEIKDKETAIEVYKKMEEAYKNKEDLKKRLKEAGVKVEEVKE